MQKIIERTPTLARIILGLAFVVFGLNGFLSFIPMPPLEGLAGELVGGLAASGYFFPLLKGTEVIVGLMLLSGRAVPLALAVLSPILINIVAFHAFLAPEGIGMGMLLLGLHLFVAWSYRDSFQGVLDIRARPRLASRPEPARPLAAHT